MADYKTDNDISKQPRKRTEANQFQVYQRGPTIWPIVLVVIIAILVIAFFAH